MPPKKTLVDKSTPPPTSMRLQQKLMASMQTEAVKQIEEVKEPTRGVGRPRKNKDIDESIAESTSNAVVSNSSSSSGKRSTRGRVDYNEDSAEEVEKAEEKQARGRKAPGRASASADASVTIVVDQKGKNTVDLQEEKHLTPAEVQANILSQRRKTVAIETSALTASQAVALSANNKSKRKRVVRDSDGEDEEPAEELSPAARSKTDNHSNNNNISSSSNRSTYKKNSSSATDTSDFSLAKREPSPERASERPSGPLHSSISSGATSYKRKSFGLLSESAAGSMTSLSAAAAVTIEEALSREKAGVWVSELEKRMEENETLLAEKYTSREEPGVSGESGIRRSGFLVGVDEKFKDLCRIVSTGISSSNSSNNSRLSGSKRHERVLDSWLSKEPSSSSSSSAAMPPPAAAPTALGTAAAAKGKKHVAAAGGPTFNSHYQVDPYGSALGESSEPDDLMRYVTSCEVIGECGLRLNNEYKHLLPPLLPSESSDRGRGTSALTVEEALHTWGIRPCELLDGQMEARRQQEQQQRLREEQEERQRRKAAEAVAAAQRESEARQAALAAAEQKKLRDKEEDKARQQKVLEQLAKKNQAKGQWGAVEQPTEIVAIPAATAAVKVAPRPTPPLAATKIEAKESSIAVGDAKPTIICAAPPSGPPPKPAEKEVTPTASTAPAAAPNPLAAAAAAKTLSKQSNNSASNNASVNYRPKDSKSGGSGSGPRGGYAGDVKNSSGNSNAYSHNNSHRRYEGQREERGGGTTDRFGREIVYPPNHYEEKPQPPQHYPQRRDHSRERDNRESSRRDHYSSGGGGGSSSSGYEYSDSRDRERRRYTEEEDRRHHHHGGHGGHSGSSHHQQHQHRSSSNRDGRESGSSSAAGYDDPAAGFHLHYVDQRSTSSHQRY